MKNYKTASLEKNALFAGLFYLLLAVTGLYAFMAAFPQVIIEDDIVKTMANIGNNEFAFRIGIASILLMNIAGILLVIYLFRLLSKINKTLALSMLVLMLFGTGLSIANEINHFAMIVINSTESLTQIEKQKFTELFVGIQKHGSYIAVVFWGLWLFPLGALIFKLGTLFSKFLGVMLIIAGLGYVLDSIFLFVYPNLNVPTITDYTSYGEFILIIWLLAKSKTIEKLALATSQQNNKI